jgi:predicted nuclease of restriction endonuclease-like (RecB) superfamily
MIRSARSRALAAVNTALISLYWQVGEYISRRIGTDGWGKGTVSALAGYIQRRRPGVRGFSAQNLWRMRQFFDAYAEQPELSPLVRELPWTHHLIILGQSKSPEEREFYLRLANRERWGKRELERQLKVGRFEPEHLGQLKIYLEALDRDVRKPHERPSIGVLLCAGKDSEVVEYALSRSLSPALVAEYQTRMPDKKVLQAKLHELYALTEELDNEVVPAFNR